MSFLREALLVAGKDLRIERRSRVAVTSANCPGVVNPGTRNWYGVGLTAPVSRYMPPLPGKTSRSLPSPTRPRTCAANAGVGSAGANCIVPKGVSRVAENSCHRRVMMSALRKVTAAASAAPASPAAHRPAGRASNTVKSRSHRMARITRNIGPMNARWM